MKIIREVITRTNNKNKKFHTLSEFRREVGIPLILAKKLIVRGEIRAEKIIDGTLRISEEELSKAKKMFQGRSRKLIIFFRELGPGLITGASDDDPGGIGTYSSVGAAFGYAILWTAAWLLPIMLAIQEACARIGIVTNHGLTYVLGKRFSRRIVFGIVFLLIIANVVNIGADLGAMAASLRMISGIDYYLGALFFAFLVILIEISFRYNVYARILKWLTISVFTYIFSGFMAHPNWSEVFQSAFVPKIIPTENYVFALIAVFGTTITPYLFFWQTSEEVEEGKLVKLGSNNLDIHNRVKHMRTDVGTGMILANVVFFFIILTTAQVLFKNGITNIESAEQAAQALRPFAGDAAYFFFALGIIGTGILAVPVLAGSGAYAFCEALRWREGFQFKFSQARGFYLIMAISVLVGLAMNFIGVEPIKALYYSAYLNGIISLPLLMAIMIVGSDRKIMGDETNPKWVKVFGWAAVGFMFLAVFVSIYFIF